MSDKTSQRTEEEMLDQTFVGYDDEMTVQTEDGAKDAAAETPASAAPKKNQNLLIYGGMGVAAVGIIAFKFLSGGSAPAPQQEPMQPAAQQQPVVAPVQAASAPVAAATIEPVPVPVTATAPVGVPTPDVTASAPVAEATAVPVQAASAPVVDPVAQFTGNTTSATLPKIEIKPEVKPEVKVEAVPAVVVSNAEASSNNDKLVAQFQKMLEEKYDPKFQKIEKSLDEQKDFNKSIEERLSRLEAGKPTKTVATKETNNSVDSSDEKTQKPVKKIVRKPIVKHTEVNSKFVSTKAEKASNVHKSDDGEVLIDRSSVKVKPEIQKIEPVYPKVEIHSIYSGRVWTKNADGTLSTFAVGDRLPTGEVIKKIDEEKEKITTDKRVISE